MPTETYPRDRFDDVPRRRHRVGAHRAENPRLRVGVVLMWSALSVVVLFCAGVVGFLTLSQQGAIAPAPEPAATVEPVTDTSYEVLILNGTGSAGLEVTAEEQLVAAGWSGEMVSGSTSDTSDFPETTVYYAAAEHEAAAAGVADALGGARIEQSDRYVADPAEKMLTVVLGLDRVSAG